MSNFQKRYSTQTVKPNRRTRIQPAPPKRCIIIDWVRRCAEFPSRTQAKRALAKLVRALPPKESPDQPKRYTIRNL